MMSLMKWMCLVLIVSLMAACASGVQEAVQAESDAPDDSVVALEPKSVEQAESSEPEQEAAEQAETPVEEDLDLPEQAELVKAIQQSLHELGYDPGPVDGIMGPRTLGAIKQFQEKMKAAETVEPSAESLKTLLVQLTIQQTSPSAADEASDVPVSRRLTLADAVKEAVEVNLQLLSQQQALVVGEQEIAMARAARFPHLNVSAQGVIIDDDRASAMLGQAEQTISGSVSLTQLLFSNRANANVSIQQQLQQVREAESERLKLDIALETAIAYLNVLRSKTYQKIQSDNVHVTESNLEQAKLRHSVGMSGPAEVYRWEAELATDQQQALEAENTRRQAEIQLNRILHRPLEERFAISEVSISDPALITGATPLLTYLEDPAKFALFRDFAVQKGLEQAPELAQLDAAITAQHDMISAISREPFLPTVAVQGEVTNRFWKDGIGSEDISGAPDDLAWSVGLQMSLPVFSGGARIAKSRQARLELERLALERSLVEEQLDLRIRAAFYSTSHSYAKILFARDAAAAAHKTLDVVSDSYKEGIASMLDLIDAQNAALVADLVVADSVHTFLIELMKSERAINRFDFFIAPEEQTQFFEEFEGKGS